MLWEFPVGSEFQVNTFVPGAQFAPAVAMDADGDFVVAWESNGQDGDGFGIFAQRYRADGTASGSEFRVNTFSQAIRSYRRLLWIPTATLSLFGKAIRRMALILGSTLNDIDADGAVQGGEIRVNTNTGSSQASPSVAMDADGDFVIAWESYGQDGGRDGIYAQRYNAAGMAQGVEFRVNTYTPNRNSPLQ